MSVLNHRISYIVVKWGIKHRYFLSAAPARRVQRPAARLLKLGACERGGTGIERTRRHRLAGTARARYKWAGGARSPVSSAAPIMELPRERTLLGRRGGSVMSSGCHGVSRSVPLPARARGRPGAPAGGRSASSGGWPARITAVARAARERREAPRGATASLRRPEKAELQRGNWSTRTRWDDISAAAGLSMWSLLQLSHTAAQNSADALSASRLVRCQKQVAISESTSHQDSAFPFNGQICSRSYTIWCDCRIEKRKMYTIIAPIWVVFNPARTAAVLCARFFALIPTGYSWLKWSELQKMVLSASCLGARATQNMRKTDSAPGRTNGLRCIKNA